MLRDRLARERHARGEATRCGLAFANEQVDHATARRIGDRRPELVVDFGTHAASVSGALSRSWRARAPAPAACAWLLIASVTPWRPRTKVEGICNRWLRVRSPVGARGRVVAVTATTPTEFAGRDGNRLAADVAGADDAPPVVLLHGGGQTRHSWGTTLGVLADRGWRAYSVDLRGHGDSAWATDGDYTLDAFADDVRAV